jgi:hydrogenase large subunit
MIVSQDALFCDLISTGGGNAYLRELARLARPVHLIAAVETCLEQTTGEEAFYIPVGPIKDGEGYGLTEATRGGLGHWVAIEDGTIRHYQVITPTAWNASPRDANGIRGPWEEALIGTSVADPRNPVELGHVIRSFDACLFCTVHVIDLTDVTADHTMAV